MSDVDTLHARTPHGERKQVMVDEFMDGRILNNTSS